MEQAPEPSSEEREAEAKRFREGLRDRGVEVSCPTCGQTQDFFGYETHPLRVIWDRTNQEGPSSGRSVHVFNYTCKRCGFVMLFDHQVLDGELEGE